MDKVRCPWCGTEMVLRDWHDIFFGKGNFFECVCGAKSPIRTSPDAAYAAALQRYVEPSAETDRTCATCASCKPSDNTNRLFCIYHGEYDHEHETYADDYCSNWLRRPTDEEREAAGWVDEAGE